MNNSERYNITHNGIFAEYVQQHVPYIRRGGQLVVTCPFHNDKHPSMYLYRSSKGTERAHCFACGADVDIIDYIKGLRGCDFLQALAVLGVSSSDSSGQKMSPSSGWQAAENSTRSEEEARRRTESEQRENAHFAEHVAACAGNLHRLMATGQNLPLYVDLWRAICANDAKFVYTVDACRYLDLLTMYGCGVDDSGRAVFPRLYVQDGRAMCQGFKAMFYDGIHRDKQRPPYSTKGASQCYFGTNIAQANAKQPQVARLPVYVVESEKTAITAATVERGVFVATGGKGNLSADGVRLLGVSDVVLLPDVDALEEWTAKGAEIEKQTGVRVRCIDICTMGEILPGTGDFCDYLLQG